MNMLYIKSVKFMGIHYDYKSTKGNKLMEKQAKREKKLAEKKAKRLAKEGPKVEEHKPKTLKNFAEILSSISRRTPQSVRMSCTCLVLAKMSLNSLTGITSNAAPLSCLFGIVCRCDKSLTFHYLFLFFIVRNFDSSFATMIIISSELNYFQKIILVGCLFFMK